MSVIETNIPIPNKRPFRQLRVNESFEIGEYTSTLHKSIGGLISYYTKVTGFKFSARRDAKGFLRVWRLA